MSSAADTQGCYYLLGHGLRLLLGGEPLPGVGLEAVCVSRHEVTVSVEHTRDCASPSDGEYHTCITGDGAHRVLAPRGRCGESCL